MKRTHAVIATQDHDCYLKGDTIGRYYSWSDADKAATRHNALYLMKLGLACNVETI